VKDWHKTKLPIVHWAVAGGEKITVVKAWQYRFSCVAIRKNSKEYPLADSPPGDWIVFYVTTGMGIATARNRDEAQRMAIAIEPLLTPLHKQVSEAIKSYLTACYALRGETTEPRYD
jgi:hypothetical protein